ncbi:MAG TPA: hypothetical protein VFW47_15115 [Phenylobacterium sp.]|nr:hypothetical protein [Phenylobacterium sp.]
MSGAVQIHVPEVRLAKLIRTPGGKPVADAMRDAHKGLQSLQADCLGELSVVLEKAEASVGRAGGSYSAQVVDELYGLVSATIGVPTTCDLKPIDTMLVSLADLLDHMQGGETWDVNAVAVHLRAFRLLLHTEAARDGAGTQAILDGLLRVSQRFAKPATETRPADADADAAAGLK